MKLPWIAILVLVLVGFLSKAKAATEKQEFCRAKDGETGTKNSFFCQIFAPIIFSPDCVRPSNRNLLAKLSEANSLPALLAQDRRRTETLLSAFAGVGEEELEEGDNAVKDKLYEAATLTLQTECALTRRVGGRWMPQARKGDFP